MSRLASSKLAWLSPRPGLEKFAPETRCNHSFTLLPPHLNAGVAVMWGGRLLSGQHSKELFRLEIGDMNIPRPGVFQWINQPQNPSSRAPDAREGHSATVFRRSLVIFGGLGPHGLYNDVAALDLATMEWGVPPVIGSPPLRRFCHA